MKKCAKLKEDLLHDEICQVYGSWANELIEKFNQLDQLDQIKIMERMDDEARNILIEREYVHVLEIALWLIFLQDAEPQNGHKKGHQQLQLPVSRR